jgi:hypothetical protein
MFYSSMCMPLNILILLGCILNKLVLVGVNPNPGG